MLLGRINIVFMLETALYQLGVNMAVFFNHFKNIEMKTINTTHIDTGGHGYYSVSKKDIELLGIADKISGYSGHNFDRVYLEEDNDGSLLYDRAKEMGIEINRKSGYNLKFNVTHNYTPQLFSYKPEPGHVIIVSGAGYTIKEVTKSKLIVTNPSGKRFKITTSNPFKYIDKVLNPTQL